MLPKLVELTRNDPGVSLDRVDWFFLGDFLNFSNFCKTPNYVGYSQLHLLYAEGKLFVMFLHIYTTGVVLHNQGLPEYLYRGMSGTIY